MRIVVVIAILLFARAAAMDFIDGHGQLFRLSDVQKSTFLASDLGVQLKQDVEARKIVDLSGMGHLKISGKSLLQVLDYAADTKLLTSQKLNLFTSQEFNPEEAELLEVANFIGVNKELLYHLSNRVWEALCWDSNRSQEKRRVSGSQGAYLGQLARPYLHSPAHVMAELKLKNVQRDVEALCQPNGVGYCICFSGHWLTYRLGSLEGLKECLEYIHERQKKFARPLVGVELNYNALCEIDIGAFVRLESNYHLYKVVCIMNFIKKITAHNTANSKMHLRELLLRDNPIETIDVTVFELAKRYRSHGKKLMIHMPGHNLSLSEIALAKQQWHLAVNTLVDRYSKGHNPDGLGVIAALLVTLGAGFAEYALKSNGMVLLIAGVGGGMASWLTLHLGYLPRLAHMMAIQTHPDIERSRADFHRPFGNAWLEDWQKPHLILKDENDEA